jgi:hypothetical protein
MESLHTVARLLMPRTGSQIFLSQLGRRASSDAGDAIARDKSRSVYPRFGKSDPKSWVDDGLLLPNPVR